jgi:hypothetical protein
MNPVVVLYLIGFGSVGIGWLLGHVGEPTTQPTTGGDLAPSWLAFCTAWGS